MHELRLSRRDCGGLPWHLMLRFRQDWSVTIVDQRTDVDVGVRMDAAAVSHV